MLIQIYLLLELTDTQTCCSLICSLLSFNTCYLLLDPPHIFCLQIIKIMFKMYDGTPMTLTYPWYAHMFFSLYILLCRSQPLSFIKCFGICNVCFVIEPMHVVFYPWQMTQTQFQHDNNHSHQMCSQKREKENEFIPLLIATNSIILTYCPLSPSKKDL